jgi:hypothetical protein
MVQGREDLMFIPNTRWISMWRFIQLGLGTNLVEEKKERKNENICNTSICRVYKRAHLVRQRILVPNKEYTTRPL